MIQPSQGRISWEIELETDVGRSRETDPTLKDFSPKNLEIPILETRADERDSVMHLDNNCVVGVYGDQKIWKY